MSLPARLKVLGACVLSLGSQDFAFGTGFRLPDQDAFATARGEAFVATADNPSAIYYNPAGITQLSGHQVRGGVYGLNLDVSYENQAGQEFTNQKDYHAIPQLFYTFTPEKFPLSIGVGAYSPYGLSSSWPQDTTFRSIATRAKLMYWTLNPVVAWKINEQLSIAAGPTFNIADLDLRQGLLPSPGAGDYFRLKSDGWTAGYNAGLLWRPHEKWQFGVSYRSETSIEFEGNTELSAPPIPGLYPNGLDVTRPATTDFAFPRNVVVGVSFRPTPDWNLEFNVDWTEWSDLGTLVIQQTPVPGLPTDVSLPLNWENSFYYEFGVTRYLAKGWSISGGYIFNENSVPDLNYQPLVADLDRHFLSIGFGHKGQHLDFDFAYQFGYGPTRTVSGNPPNQVGESVDGRYEFLSHALIATIGWRF